MKDGNMIHVHVGGWYIPLEKYERSGKCVCGNNTKIQDCVTFLCKKCRRQEILDKKAVEALTGK